METTKQGPQTPQPFVVPSFVVWVQDPEKDRLTNDFFGLDVVSCREHLQFVPKQARHRLFAIKTAKQQDVFA